MKQIKHGIFLAVIAAAFSAMVPFVSCAFDFFDHERVKIGLPETPPALKAAAHGHQVSWTLFWYDENGTKQCARGVTGDMEIELPRGIFTPVILEPETEALGIPYGSIPPAGALYPADCTTGSIPETGRGPVTLDLSWQGGVSASMAESICRHARGGIEDGRIIASHVNWRRFGEEASKLREPHRIAEKRFVEAALSGAVTKWDVSEPDDIAVGFPSILSAGKQAAQASILTAAQPAVGETLWPEWPGAESFQWPDVANALTIEAYEGLNRFFGESGYVTVSVVEGKIAAAFFTPYSLQD